MRAATKEQKVFGQEINVKTSGIRMKKIIIYLCGAMFLLPSCAGDNKKEKDSKDLNGPGIEKLQSRAQAGDPNAQYALANMYCFGQGVKQDYRQAARWYRRSAEQGYGPAQYDLALMYERGTGVIEDANEALKWHRKAAEQGITRAQVNLGMLYTSNKSGEQDYNEAVKWFVEAARQNDPIAQYNLALMYANGHGVARDYVESYKWALLAGMNGQNVQQIKVFLAQKMTREEIAKAQNLAKAFVEKTNNP
jgi:TPR repeat protein